MIDSDTSPQFTSAHSHIFLGAGNERNERKTWAVIWLCGIMMLVEIVGGNLFGSLALVTDGLHMSTHAGAVLISALTYTYARRHVNDARFVFGTGKLDDLARFTSATVLAIIALLIGYEALVRLVSPVHINFNEAIPIAIMGLLVNLVSAWLLRGDHHEHSQEHSHGDCRDNASQLVDTLSGVVAVEVFEDGVPPRFHLRFEGHIHPSKITIETERPDGHCQTFTFIDRGVYLESLDEISEPHEFKATLHLDNVAYKLVFTEHDHRCPSSSSDDAHLVKTHRDNNISAACVHVTADAAISILAITGLVLGSHFGWVWIDPAVGIVGAVVIANWSYGLLRDTGSILLDMNPNQHMKEKVRKILEVDGDQLADLHLWRLGPGHMGVIVSVVTKEVRDVAFYRARLGHFNWLSHVTIEVRR